MTTILIIGGIWLALLAFLAYCIVTAEEMPDDRDMPNSDEN